MEVIQDQIRIILEDLIQLEVLRTMDSSVKIFRLNNKVVNTMATQMVDMVW